MDTQNSNFKNKLNRLEEIYNIIKTMEVSDLEKLIELYQEGIQLSKLLNHELNSFEQKIIEIKENIFHADDAAPPTTPFNQDLNSNSNSDLNSNDSIDDKDVDFSDITEDFNTEKDATKNIEEETNKDFSQPSHTSSPKKKPDKEYIVDLFLEDEDENEDEE